MSELAKCRCGAAADVPEDRGDYYRIECLGECDFYVSAPTIEGVVSVWNSLMHPPREGMTNETTPDAVTMLQRMHARAAHSENHGDVPRIGSDEVLAVLRAIEDERARHTEEVAALRAQLWEMMKEWD